MSEVDHRTWKGSHLNSTYAKVQQQHNGRWMMLVYGANNEPVAVSDGHLSRELAVHAAETLGFAPNEITDVPPIT